MRDDCGPDAWYGSQPCHLTAYTFPYRGDKSFSQGCLMLSYHVLSQSHTGLVYAASHSMRGFVRSMHICSSGHSMVERGGRCTPSTPHEGPYLAASCRCVPRVQPAGGRTQGQTVDVLQTQPMRGCALGACGRCTVSTTNKRLRLELLERSSLDVSQ